MSAPENFAPSNSASLASHPPRLKVCSLSFLDREILTRALRRTVRKLDPRILGTNPVMFVAGAAAVLASLALLQDLITRSGERVFELAVAVCLWVTVLFGNFAEALAEAAGKAYAKELRMATTNVLAKRVGKGGKLEVVAASQLCPGNIVFAEAGDLIPGDGEIIEGIATIDESVVTGESAPVIRESTGDLRAVTAGSRVISDSIRIRIASNPPETFLDRTIAAAEEAQSQKTAAELKLNGFLSVVALLLAVAVTASFPFVAQALSLSVNRAIVVLTGLLVGLLPTTIGGLLPAISVGALNQAMLRNVLAKTRNAFEALGRINLLLLDKTGTLTFGNREAVDFLPFPEVSVQELSQAAQLASLADTTPEGRSIVALARDKYGAGNGEATEKMIALPFSSYTRLSGIDVAGRKLRKGATSAIAGLVKESGKFLPSEFQDAADRISRTGGTPLAVSDDGRVLGLIALQDVVKGGMGEQIDKLRRMGIRSVMLTGDNPVTAAAIGREAGVDEVLAQATPADKLAYIKKHQAVGHKVAMTGDGSEDGPAIAQADVGIAMDTGEMPAKEAANMVDLDSNPAKLPEIFAIGKKLLTFRSALTAFSIANGLSILFVVVPLVFAPAYPSLARLNYLGLESVKRAILAAILYKALALLAFTPVALHGGWPQFTYSAAARGQTSLAYAICGLIVPVPFIWALEKILTLFGLN